MSKTRSLIRIWLYSLIAFSAVPVVILGWLWVAVDYARFTEQADTWRANYIESKQDLLQREVEKAADYLDFKRRQLNQTLYVEIRKEAREAKEVLGGFHDRVSERRRQALLDDLRRSLAPMRFHNGRGFFFLIDAADEPRGILSPLHPETRRRIDDVSGVKALAQQVRSVTEGGNSNFMQYRFAAAQPGQEPWRNISYVMHDPVLNVYLGASVYLNDEVENIKREVLERLASLPFDANSSVLFVTDVHGEQLVNPYNPEQIGEPMAAIAGSGLHQLEQAEDSEWAQGRSLRLYWQNVDKGGTAPVESWVKLDPAWGWVIGAGFFLEEVDALVEAERAELESDVFRRIRLIVLAALSLVLIAVLMSRYAAGVSARALHVFEKFFREAAQRSIHIDTDKLPFVEFRRLADEANHMVKTRGETERALRLSEQRFQLALGAAHNHLWDLDIEEFQISVSPSFYRELGYEAPDVPQDVLKFLDVCHPDDRDQMRESLEGWAEYNGEQTLEFRLRDRWGNYHWIHSRGDLVHPDGAGQAERAMGIMTDISQRKAMEEHLIRARVEAEDANRAKSQFLSSVSHELRTPLNGVLGYTQLMLRDREVPDGQKDNLRAIETCGQHLLTLINETLDLAKMESGRMSVDPRPCRLQDIIDGVGDIVRPRARNKGVHFELTVEDSAPQLVHLDVVKVRQVLVNRADNAVKFTDGGGSVTLAVKRSDAGRLYFSVTDTGMGIPKDHLQSIFEPFSQVNPQEGIGTGLGLAICYRLIEAMGGLLRCRSEMGKGSVFEFDLPVEEADAKDDLYEVSELQQSSLEYHLPENTKVLVVDDNLHNRRILEAMLEDDVDEVILAESGDEAVTLFQEHRPDLVLMDLRMPELDGIESTKRIRQLEEGKDAVVVMVSAISDEAIMKQALGSGVDEWLAKPVQYLKLMQCLSELMSMRVEQAAANPPAPATTLSGWHIPQSYRQPLLDAAAMGDVQSLQQQLSEIEADSADYIGFVSEARSFVAQFDFHRLQQLIESMGDGTDE